jgi:hypothetical protein
MLSRHSVLGVLFAAIMLICLAPGSVAVGGLSHRQTRPVDLEGGVATGNGWVVVDPRRDRLIRVGPRGRVCTLAVFPARLVPAGPGGRPILLRSVPSAVVRGPDGAFYVGELTSFPYPRGRARVWRVVPGQAPTVYATGFTAIRTLSFGPGERLFVLDSDQRQTEAQSGHPGGGERPGGGPGQLFADRRGQLVGERA